MTGALTPLDQWKLAELGDAGAPDLADPDGDGLVNLIEYGLVLPPLQAGVPASGIGDYPGGRYLRLRLTRDPARNDVTVSVEAAGDAAGPFETIASSANGAPFAGAGYVSGDGPGPGLKDVEVRDTVPSIAALRRFLRVRVVH